MEKYLKQIKVTDDCIVNLHSQCTVLVSENNDLLFKSIFTYRLNKNIDRKCFYLLNTGEENINVKIRNFGNSDYQKSLDIYKEITGVLPEIKTDYLLNIINNLIDFDCSEKKVIAVIRNIENNLHPKAQKRVVKVLLKYFSDMQFIITTYSPFILMDLKANQIVELYHLQGVLTSKTRIEDTKNTDISFILLKYFDLYSVLSPSLQEKIDRYYEV